MLQDQVGAVKHSIQVEQMLAKCSKMFGIRKCQEFVRRTALICFVRSRKIAASDRLRFYDCPSA